MGATGRQLWFLAGVGDGLMAACSFLHTTPHHTAGVVSPDSRPSQNPRGRETWQGSQASRRQGIEDPDHSSSQAGRRMGVDGGWNKGNDSVGTGDGLQDVVGRITTGPPSHDRP